MDEVKMGLFFLLCFSLHNLEEALWLPGWSKYAKRYHKKVNENGFRFAVLAVTVIGYLITFQYFIFSGVMVSKLIYCGFILMMAVNVIFPHLAATIALRKYAPGVMTGIFLNAPVGVYILVKEIKTVNELAGAIAAGVIISGVILFLLKHLFIAGEKFTR